MTYSSAKTKHSNDYLISESIRRTVRNSNQGNEFDPSYGRLYYYRNPKNDKEIAVILRLKSPYRNYFDKPIFSNFHIANPPEGAIQINDFQLSQMMKMHNKY